MRYICTDLTGTNNENGMSDTACKKLYFKDFTNNFSKRERPNKSWVLQSPAIPSYNDSHNKATLPAPYRCKKSGCKPRNFCIPQVLLL